MIVDVHAHALNETFLAGLTARPVGGLLSVADGKGGYAIRRAMLETGSITAIPQPAALYTNDFLKGS